MTESDLTYRGTQGATHSLIPSAVLMQHPATAEAAKSEGQRLQFDFYDDAEVLELLRFRRVDQDQAANKGILNSIGAGIPFAVAAFFVYAAAGATDAPAGGMAILLGVAAVFALIGSYFVWRLMRWQRRVYNSPERQNMRARVNAYRRIAKAARKHEADIPRFYPHVIPYRTNAKFHPEAADAGCGAVR